MKIRKQLRKLQELLDVETRERENRRDDLKRLLRKMKAKERELGERALAATDPEEAARLRRKIDMLHAQRKKGVRALRELGSGAP